MAPHPGMPKSGCMTGVKRVLIFSKIEDCFNSSTKIKNGSSAGITWFAHSNIFSFAAWTAFFEKQMVPIIKRIISMGIRCFLKDSI